MTLQERYKWSDQTETRLRMINESKGLIQSQKADRYDYYSFVSHTAYYAMNCYIRGDFCDAKSTAKLAVSAVLQYFYGDWRKLLLPPGEVEAIYWKEQCLWADEIVRTVPFAAALGDWEAAKRIAEYPADDQFPEAPRAKGEMAWIWALITLLREKPTKEIEHFLAKAELTKQKRPKMLTPILRSIVDRNESEYRRSMTEYLEFYKKYELKHVVDKLVCLDGTTLYHLAQRQGLTMKLPQEVADHIIKFD